METMTFPEKVIAEFNHLVEQHDHEVSAYKDQLRIARAERDRAVGELRDCKALLRDRERRIEELERVAWARDDALLGAWRFCDNLDQDDQPPLIAWPCPTCGRRLGDQCGCGQEQPPR